MLSGIQIAMIGGDTCQLEMIHKFLDLDATVKLIGFDNMQNEFNSNMKVNLDQHVLKHIDAVILPVAGADESGIIESAFSLQELRMNCDHARSLPKHAKIYTGTANTYLKNLCSNHQIEIVELFERPEVSIYNSISTAEDAIFMGIQNTDITIHDSQCLVLGFGQTGITLSRALLALGAKVKVGDVKDENVARAYQLGFDSFYLNDLTQQIAGVDLLFNTIPAMVVTAPIILNLPRLAVIIDLASKPGGTDFCFANKTGIRAIHTASLPGIRARKTAGRFLANTISQLILEDLTRKQTPEPVLQ
jgi:dipicolinate synthase subunit A